MEGKNWRTESALIMVFIMFCAIPLSSAAFGSQERGTGPVETESANSEKQPDTEIPASEADDLTNEGQVGKNEVQSGGPYAEKRRSMVAQQIEARGVEATAVLKAMRQVPRHEFVGEKQRGQAYSDKPLPIGHGQTISQPYIVAYMTEVLELQPGDKVLEIGTGSGYQAAVLAEITDSVFTIEIIEELAEQAATRLQQLGYNEVRTKQADGYHGWEEHAPFDAIIVTAAAGHIPPPLLKQLKPDGRMVIPVGGVYEVQSLMLIRKTADGEIQTERLMPVRFVPFQGAAQKR